MTPIVPGFSPVSVMEVEMVPIKQNNVVWQISITEELTTVLRDSTDFWIALEILLVLPELFVKSKFQAVQGIYYGHSIEKYSETIILFPIPELKIKPAYLIKQNVMRANM